MESDQQQESRSPRSDRATKFLCRFVVGGHGPCYEDVSWFLEGTNEKELGFYVCDAHLAAGVKASGLPARIEAPDFTPKKRVSTSWRPLPPPKIEYVSDETE